MTIARTRISYVPWGVHDGQYVYLFKLLNDQGAYVEITNYGAALVSAWVPDRTGQPGNVVLGFSSLEGYLNDTCYIGSTIGRVANRIGQASFELDGRRVVLEQNDYPHTNHGGAAGFNARVFNFYIDGDTLVLSLTSADGDGGYPGALQLEVLYSWGDDQVLTIRYRATTDKKTVANFTNHAYFNLSAAETGILDHELTIRASRVLESLHDYIPTGEILPSDAKSFAGDKLKTRFTKVGNLVTGLNTYYIFDADDAAAGGALCTLLDPISGRQLDVFTSYPGVQVYTGDYLTSSLPGSHDVSYKPFDGMCLECQHYPDSPNHASFPSIVLDRGQAYDETIRLKFSVKK